MRAILGAIALALATGGLGWTLGDRNKPENHPSSTFFQPTLYRLHVRAVDSESGESVAMRVSWAEEVSPFAKGSGPCRIEEFADGARSISVVGLPLANGLIFTVAAEGYRSETLVAKGWSSGIVTDQPEGVITVRLVKSRAGD